MNLLEAIGSFLDFRRPEFADGYFWYFDTDGRLHFQTGGVIAAIEVADILADDWQIKVDGQWVSELPQSEPEVPEVLAPQVSLDWTDSIEHQLRILRDEMQIAMTPGWTAPQQDNHPLYRQRPSRAEED